jgi:hypothetical protein
MGQEIDQLVVSDGYIPYNEVLELQGKVSVNLILESVASESPFLPGKFPHCVTANKPILHLGPEKSEVKRLLGEDYNFHAVADDVDKISELIEVLFNEWKNLKKELKLDRKDLEDYLSPKFLKSQLGNFI